jgi:hypothetical protein
MGAYQFGIQGTNCTYNRTAFFGERAIGKSDDHLL